MTRRRLPRGLWMLALLCSAILAGTVSGALGLCPPFTDVSDPAFCSLVQEIFYLGITTGTTATTYDPAGNVTRLQMAAFLSRTVDRTLSRGSRRAALQQFWRPKIGADLSVTTIGGSPAFVASDGSDLWVSESANSAVKRVRGGDGKFLETWTGVTVAAGVISALGRIFVADQSYPGSLKRIDPSQAPGVVTTVASNLGNGPTGLAFDGLQFWTANIAGSISIVTPGASLPWAANTLSGPFVLPVGALYDGANVWISDLDGRLFRMDGNGSVLQTVTLGNAPQHPAFDGENLWVPNNGNFVSIVRASSGAILATLTGNGLNGPFQAAFDGGRVMVTNNAGGSVSLWQASNLSPLGSVLFPAGGPRGVCSDGVSFWIALQGAGKLARF